MDRGCALLVSASQNFGVPVFVSASPEQRHVSGEALRKPGTYTEFCWAAVSTRLLQRFRWDSRSCVHLSSYIVCRNGEKIYKLSTGNNSSSFEFPHFNTNQPRLFFFLFSLKIILLLVLI